MASPLSLPQPRSFLLATRRRPAEAALDAELDALREEEDAAGAVAAGEAEAAADTERARVEEDAAV